MPPKQPGATHEALLHRLQDRNRAGRNRRSRHRHCPFSCLGSLVDDMTVTRPWQFKDLSGQRFGRLVAQELAGKNADRAYTWHCLCDCGEKTVAPGSGLRRGSSQSCGCLQRDKARVSGAMSKRHAMYGTRTYIVWAGMLQRCNNPIAPGYRRYGQRGISVCAEWHDFAAFLRDMGERPAGTSIDRINNDGNYEPGNCRWATRKQQARNTSANRVLHYQGKSMSVADWAETTGVSYNLLRRRVLTGWPAERAITTPVTTKFRRKEPA